MVASYLVLRLTGEYVLDHQSASHCTPLYDLDERAWNRADRLDDVTPGLKMPRLGWASDPAGTIRAPAADEVWASCGSTPSRWAPSMPGAEAQPASVCACPVRPCSCTARP